MDLLTLSLIVLIIIVGFYTEWWIALIGIVLLFAYAYGARNERRPPAPAGGIKVRPIIVQRRYAGPESIYPRLMQMRINPAWDTRPWFDQAAGAFGRLMGWAVHGGRPHSPKED